MTPLVSIIVTTYNKANLMQVRALRSAINQTFNDCEIIIVDHGSTDHTKQVVKVWQKRYHRIRYINIKKNSGIVSTARNTGAKEAKGKYVVFIDDDNKLLPEFIEKTVSFIESYDELYGNLDAVATGRIVRFEKFEDCQPAPTGKYAAIDWGWLIKREVFDKIQYDENMFFNEDADFGLQFHQRFNYRTINQPLQVAYDSFGAAMKTSHSIPNPKMIESIDYFLKKNLHYYEDPNELRYLYNLIARRYFKFGMKKKAITHFWLSFATQPSLRTVLHLVFSFFGSMPYNWFKGLEERISSKLR